MLEVHPTWWQHVPRTPRRTRWHRHSCHKIKDQTGPINLSSVLFHYLWDKITKESGDSLDSLAKRLERSDFVDILEMVNYLTVSSQTWVTSSVMYSVLQLRATATAATGPATDPTTAPPSPGATTISPAPSAMRTPSPETDLKALPSLSASSASTFLKVFPSSEAGTKSAMAEARTQQKSWNGKKSRSIRRIAFIGWKVIKVDVGQSDGKGIKLKEKILLQLSSF